MKKIFILFAIFFSLTLFSQEDKSDRKKNSSIKSLTEEVNSRRPEDPIEIDPDDPIDIDPIDLDPIDPPPPTESIPSTLGFHDTQGKLDVSSSGQLNYTLPIALPASIQNVGPTINLVYTSGQMGGIAGQGWGISSISAISRIATRIDIDGFVDGVDFDDNDKLALDGQRLLLVSGVYWQDGSVYQTETHSNYRVELKGSRNSMYFIVYAPDGSKSWYGNFGGATAVDFTSFYITRFEDINGNFITYHYIKPFNKSLCISEIKFSANVNGLTTPLNNIKFNYRLAKRTEYGYFKGVKLEKVELLDNIVVKTNNLLFKKYQISHIVDTQLGYERVSQIQEFNANLEPANPVVFNYDTTTTQNAGSEILTSYNNNLNFNNVELSGDFDGDGNLDFITEDKFYNKLFQGSSGQVGISLPLEVSQIRENAKFISTITVDGKLRQSNSLSVAIENSNNIEFKIFNFSSNSFSSVLTKNILINNEGVFELFNGPYPCGPGSNIFGTKYTKKSNEFLEGDFNGDGISEVLFLSSINEKSSFFTPCPPPYSYDPIQCPCIRRYDFIEFKPYLINFKNDLSNNIGTEGFAELTGLSILRTDKKIIQDFNGDGKADILIIDENKNYKLYTINQLSSAPWYQVENIGQGIIDKYSKDKQTLFGDYNGDGKIDLMLPDTEGGSGHTLWHIYYSNPNPTGGNFFVKESHNIVEYWPTTGSYYNTQTHFSNYYALDVNNDGKSDLVRIWRKYYKPSWTINDHDTQWTIKTYINNIGNTLVSGDKFTLDYTTPCQTISTPNGEYQNCNHNSDSPDLPIPVVANYKYSGLNNQIVMVRNHYNQVTYINFNKDVAKDIRINKVISSGGNIIDDIEYNITESSSANTGTGLLNEFYSSSNELEYPFVEMKRLPTNYLVSKLKNTTQGVIKNQDFRYHGLMVNLHGLGILGYKKTARSAWYQDPFAKRIWNVYENRHDWRGGLQRAYSQLVDNGNAFSFLQTGSPTNLISMSTNNYSTSIVNGLYKIQLNSQITFDGLTSVSKQTSYNYDPVFLLPTTVSIKNFTNDINNPVGEKVINTIFENNPIIGSSTYYIGRPLEINTSTSAYGDNNIFKEVLTYTNNKLTKSEKRGNTTDNKFLVEDYEYNAVGNLIKKIISSTGYNSPESFQPRVIENTYDSTERFVKTSKDVEGLVTTNVSYHPVYGIVTEFKNPYNLTTKTYIDHWGKPYKVTDYLGKNATITYAKNGNEYTVNKVGEDGSKSIEVSDALARIVKTGVLNIDGNWSYKNIQYDYLGRKFKESEPYSSGSPSLWDVSSYDDYGRLIKIESSCGLVTNITHNGLSVSATDGVITKSSTKNANGHVVSATDNGGTINFTYYADGNLETSNYNGTEIRTEYDEWGRKKLLNDPSAGEYTYSYNAIGDLLTESTPNGTTTLTYDDYGKVLEKTIVGVNTDSKSTFTYDATTKLLTNLKYEDFNNGGAYDEYTYNYDSFMRLHETFENKFGAFFQRVTLYDAFGRPEKENYNVISNGKQSSKWVKNVYKNGHHWQIVDDATNQMLWQVNTVNERGQTTSAKLGNSIDITNTFDIYGYPTQFKHEIASVGNVMTLNTVFDPLRGNLTSRYNSMFNWTENFQYDNQDRLTHYTDKRGILIQQIYENDGRIKENNLGKYNYSNSAKKYQNTSIDVTPESRAYYENRLGLFNEGMESKTGFIIYEPTVVTFDDTVSRSGNVSLKINNTTTGEKVVSSEIWTKINNSIPTEYTYSGWVKSDGSNPEAELFLFMKTENETGYFTQVDQVTTNTTSSWIYFEKTVIVPANIKKLSLRLDNNATGILWFDDLRIRKTSDATTAERKLNITYNTFKSPYQIEETGVDKISFTYNHFQNRGSMFYGGLEVDKYQRQYQKHYSADGSMEIKLNTQNNEVELITYIGGNAYSAPLLLKSDGTTQEYLYLHRDYQGTILAITNQTGTIVEKRLFDAWGEVVKIQDAQGNILSNFAVLDRGYTGHEHLNSVGLIHMNGRLYDAKLHRFLQPDNFIQDPYNTQNYNRYGYVLNNPLKHIDPSGEELISLTAVIIGAAIAAASYTMTALLADVPFTPGGFIQATFMGAVSGAVASGIGSVAETIKQLGYRMAFQAVAHGVTQGIMSEAQGGSFGQGFISGSLSSIAAGLWQGGSMEGGSGHWGGFGGDFAGKTTGTLLFGTVAGGAGALLAKGNFWQGAVTGLIVSGLNHAAHGGFAKKYKLHVLEDYEGANGAGHQALVGDVDGDLLYVSKDGTNENNGVYGEAKYTIKTFDSFEAINDYYFTKVSPGEHYDSKLTFKVTKAQMQTALKTAIRWAKMPYDVMNNSCTTIVQAGLINAGILNVKNYNMIPDKSFKIMSKIKYKPAY